MRFRPGLVPTLGMLGAVALLAGLGSWQVRRYHWKQALLAEWSARSALPPISLAAAQAAKRGLEYRRVRLRGRYDRDRTVLLLHQERGLREGARVLTPLRETGRAAPTPAVLVDRGWIPAGHADRFLASEKGESPADVTGIARRVDFGAPPAGGPRPPQRTWNRFRPRRLQAQLPYRLGPVLVIREDDGSTVPPLGGYDPPRSRVDHRLYAITWFSMAGLAVATWVGLGLRQGREGDSAGRPAPPAPPSP